MAPPAEPRHEVLGLHAVVRHAITDRGLTVQIVGLEQSLQWPPGEQVEGPDRQSHVKRLVPRAVGTEGQSSEEPVGVPVFSPAAARNRMAETVPKAILVIMRPVSSRNGVPFPRKKQGYLAEAGLSFCGGK